MAKKEVAEYCAECENEVILQWDTEVDGFEIVCPYCGAKLMLCDECQHAVCENGEPQDCDWCDETKCCHRCKSVIAEEEKRLQWDLDRRLLQKTAHERYKLYWCMTHSITIDEISHIADLWAEEIGGGSEDYVSFRNYLEETGFFSGPIWPCLDEFVECEYQIESLMREILDDETFARYIELEHKDYPVANSITIEVETPHGRIVARNQNDADYPGISLFFVPEGTETEYAGCVMEFNPTYHPDESVDKTIPSVNLRIYEREDPFNEPQQVLIMEPLHQDNFGETEKA